jgi:hypothetical protein
VTAHEIIRTEILTWDVLPDSGWVSKPIRGEDDVGEVIELFRLSYERARWATRSPSAAASRSG